MMFNIIKLLLLFFILSLFSCDNVDDNSTLSYDNSLNGYHTASVNYSTLDLNAKYYELEKSKYNGFIVDNSTDKIQYTSIEGDKSIKLYIVPKTGNDNINYKVTIYDNDTEVFESQEFKGINEIDFKIDGSHNLTFKIKSDSTFQYFFTFILFAPNWNNYIQINNQPLI